MQKWLTVYAKIHDKKEKERDQKEREKVSKKRRKGVNDKISSHTIGIARTCSREKNLGLGAGGNGFVVNTFSIAEQIKK